jgi:hypothetical protein
MSEKLSVEVCKDNRKAIPQKAWTGSVGFGGFYTPSFLDNRHMKIARLSALRPAAFTPKEIFLELISVTS